MEQTLSLAQVATSTIPINENGIQDDAGNVPVALEMIEQIGSFAKFSGLAETMNGDAEAIIIKRNPALHFVEESEGIVGLPGVKKETKEVVEGV